MAPGWGDRFRMLVERMGGRIWVRSGEGIGTTILLYATAGIIEDYEIKHKKQAALLSCSLFLYVEFFRIISIPCSLQSCNPTSFNLNFCILPLPVIGNSSMKNTYFGIL